MVWPDVQQFIEMFHKFNPKNPSSLIEIDLFYQLDMDQCYFTHSICT